MKSFDEILKEKLKDENYASEYYAQKEFSEISYNLLKKRQAVKISQSELAKLAFVTQQQISKIEKGVQCNSITLFKIVRALECKLTLLNAKENSVEEQRSSWLAKSNVDSNEDYTVVVEKSNVIPFLVLIDSNRTPDIAKKVTWISTVRENSYSYEELAEDMNSFVQVQVK